MAGELRDLRNLPSETSLGVEIAADVTGRARTALGGPRRGKKGFFLRAETAFSMTETLGGRGYQAEALPKLLADTIDAAVHPDEWVALGTPAVGRCIAKTGTLNGVTNLAGYCKSGGGQDLAFAYFLDGPTNAAGLFLLGHAVGDLARLDVTRP